MYSQPRFQPVRTEVLSRTGSVPREMPHELPVGHPVCSRRLCVPQLLAAVAYTSPESVALSFGGLRMTYGQLNAQADRLATNLRSLGVGPEVPVAVCLERSFEYVVSALA